MEFRDPPKSKYGPGATGISWKEIGEKLRARPYEWAYIYTASSASIATSIKSGRYPSLGPGPWETRTHKVPGGHEIYVRYVPEEII